MKVVDIGCDKHTKCPPELDSGAFSNTCFRFLGKAPDQASKGAGSVTEKKGQCVKAMNIV